MEVSSVVWSSCRSGCVLLLLACGGLHSSFDGGGGGGTDGAGGSGGGSGVGGSGGAGAGLFSIGTWQSADAGAFTFQDITPSVSGFGSAIERIAGTSKTNMYIGDSSGTLNHFDGQTWSTLVTFPSETGFSGLYLAPNGALYASGLGTRIYWCPSGCDMLTSWNYEDHDAVQFGGLCGAGTAVYAVGRIAASGQGIVYQFNTAMGTWLEMSGARFANDYAACVVGSDGMFYVAADRYVIEVSPGGTANQIDLTGHDLVGASHWYALGKLGDDILIVGDKKRIARRTAGHWTLLLDYPNYDLAGWYGVTSSNPAEAFLGGDGSDSIVNIGGLGIVTASTTITTFKAPPDFLVRAIWAADDNTLFMSGETNVLESNTHDEVIYRVTH
jgi:hypothetical protein